METNTVRFPVLSGQDVWRIAILLYAILLTSLHMAITAPFRLASFDRLVAFEAAEPFQHRLLIPAIVAGIQSVLPVGEELLFALCEVVAWTALFVVAYRILVLFEIGQSEFIRRVLVFTLIVPMAMHVLVPNLVLYPLFEVDAGVLEIGTWRAQTLFYYAYDVPAAVFTLALVLVMVHLARTRSPRWLAAYLGLFAIATINRETTLFLIPVFAIVFYPVFDRWTLLKAVVLQCVIFAVIQGTLQWMFAGNINPNSDVPGTHYENHFLENLGRLLNPLYLLTFLARFSAGFHFPVLLLYRHLDPLLARILFWFGLPFMLFALFFGRIQEQRIFIELVPLIWLGGVQALAAWRSTAVVERQTP
jgi:hypothetical protein